MIPAKVLLAPDHPHVTRMRDCVCSHDMSKLGLFCGLKYLFMHECIELSDPELSMVTVRLGLGMNSSAKNLYRSINSACSNSYSSRASAI